jgi:hypothetical protein
MSSFTDIVKAAQAVLDENNMLGPDVCHCAPHGHQMKYKDPQRGIHVNLLIKKRQYVFRIGSRPVQKGQLSNFVTDFQHAIS